MNININKNNVKKGFVPYVFLLLALLAIYYCFNILNREVHMLGYNDLVVELDKNNVFPSLAKFSAYLSTM